MFNDSSVIGVIIVFGLLFLLPFIITGYKDNGVIGAIKLILYVILTSLISFVLVMISIKSMDILFIFIEMHIKFFIVIGSILFVSIITIVFYAILVKLSQP